MALREISKAIGAGVGGAVAGSAALPFMPDGTPWYGYLILYGMTILLPMLATYIAPQNKT